MKSSQKKSYWVLILRDTEKARSIDRILNVRKAKFQLFKKLVNRTP